MADICKRNASVSSSREWLVANGLGGYASGTLEGAPTRRYHGLLVAALPAPFGRMVMLNHLRAVAVTPNGEIDLDMTARDFHLANGVPVWRCAIGGTVVEKRVFMPHGQNTVHVLFRVVAGGRIRLKLRPYLKVRPLNAAVDVPLPQSTLNITADRYEIASDGGLPPLRLYIDKNAVLSAHAMIEHCHFPLEARRGYAAQGAFWSPGAFSAELDCGALLALTASTESWDALRAHSVDEALRAEESRLSGLLESAAPAARDGLGAELVLAADKFVITPAASRVEEQARARASGDDVRSVIAGYHWFTDWGRDTMVSLEGLTLVTGRGDEAGCILRTFANYVRDGLIPNLFPEGEKDGLYHTADATLWFFHALGRYVDATGDRATLRSILPKLLDIFDHHMRGTRFGIGVDHRDGLLTQGAPGYQLTWMDAKVGDWVVTPRRGKAVEINALWYNALRLLERWLQEEGHHTDAERVGVQAQRAYESFNRRFWNDAGGFLFDVVDGEHGDDALCRPNQIFAMALGHPVLDASRCRAVLDIVTERLLTPFGLRTLAPGEAEYKAHYFGDRRARDAAYHQGTVWPWLIGPYVDAWLRVYPHERQHARELLAHFASHLSEAGVGFISEVFDAEAPYHARGCIAQAWSVAEVLRAFVKTAA